MIGQRAFKAVNRFMINAPKCPAHSNKPCFSIASNTASAQAHATGLPPNVEACVPGVSA